MDECNQMSSDPSVHLTVALSQQLRSSGYDPSEETVLAKGDTFRCSSGKLFVIVHFTVRSLQDLERAVHHAQDTADAQ